MKIERIIIFIFISIFLIGTGFSVGFFYGKSLVHCEICQPQEINFSLFWEAYHKLKEQFVDKEKLDTQKIIYGAISGMVKSLGDPYTVFMSPAEVKKFEEDVKGSFEGIGAEIDIKKGQLLIVAPLEGTPAQKAGLRAGDKILKINDTLTSDLTIDEAVDLIRGPKGTEVTLTILRSEWDNPKEIKITRDIIFVPSLKWEKKDPDIAYIKLYQFSERASFDFRTTAIDILNSGNKKIILDLRDNPGGYLDVAQDIAGWFLKKGQTVVIEDFGNGREKKEHNSRGPSNFSEFPVIVLINKGSASASEILAGALRDNRDILLIGEKSFGKGSVQQMEDLSDGSSLKITIAKWLTPKGEIITDKGIEPDVKVEMTEEDYKEGRDPQLDKAIELIREMR